MKKNKIVSIILLFLIILPIVFTSCQSDNRDIPGSFKISDEEWTLLKDAGASSKKNIVKIYRSGLNPNRFPFGESLSELEEMMTQDPFYYDVKEKNTYSIYDDGSVDTIYQPVSEVFSKFFKRIYNTEMLFSSTDATKNLVSELEIYEVDLLWNSHRGEFAVFYTSRGEFVYLKQCYLNIEMESQKEYNEYLMPIQKYTEVAKILNEVSGEFKDMRQTPYPAADELIDLSEYEVKRPNNIIIPIIAVSVVVIGASVAAAVIIKRRKGNKKAEISEEQ